MKKKQIWHFAGDVGTGYLLGRGISNSDLGILAIAVLLLLWRGFIIYSDLVNDF